MNAETFFAKVREFFGKLSQSQVDGFNTILAATAALNTRHRAYILATVWHETAFTMQPIIERGSRAYFVKYNAGTTIGKTLGNTLPGDGYRFRGRGYVQLTGRRNYMRASLATGVDLIADPDRATDPEIAAKIMISGMTAGWFTGKKLADFGNYLHMRKVINGMDRAGDIAGYAHRFETALNA